MSAVDDCLAQALDVPGVRLVTLLDYLSGLPIAVAGNDELSADEDASGIADVVQKVLSTPATTAAQTGDDLEEVILVGASGYHVLVLAEGLCLRALLTRDADLMKARSHLKGVLHRLVTP